MEIRTTDTTVTLDKKVIEAMLMFFDKYQQSYNQETEEENKKSIAAGAVLFHILMKSISDVFPDWMLRSSREVMIFEYLIDTYEESVEWDKIPFNRYLHAVELERAFENFNKDARIAKTEAAKELAKQPKQISMFD